MTTNIEEAIDKLLEEYWHESKCSYDDVLFSDSESYKKIKTLLNTVNREKWVNIDTELPKKERVLTYSPDLDDTMKLRILDACFVKTMSEVTRWKYINPPKEYE